MVVDYYQNQNVIDGVHVNHYDDCLDLHDQTDHHRHHLVLLVRLDDYHLQMNGHLVGDHVDHDHDLDHVVNVNDL
jgi:hypothetical protein